MDHRELNKFVDAYTVKVDICAQKLREWWQQGSNIATLNLRRAYLQVWVHQLLWPFLTVIIKGWRYCLTWLGFGLNVASKIMSVIMNVSCRRMSKFEGQRHLTTKVSSEMLIRMRLATLTETIKEYNLSVDVWLNWQSTEQMHWLVLLRWLITVQKESEPLQLLCTASALSIALELIMSIHEQCGHLGIKWTLYF